MHIQTPIESVRATNFTGSLSGLFGWESERSAVYFGTRTQIEITPDERPELDLLAGHMVAAMNTEGKKAV